MKNWKTWVPALGALLIAALLGAAGQNFVFDSNSYLLVNSNPYSQRMTAGGPAPGQAIKTFSGRVQMAAGSTTPVSLYTVSTGKTLYITDIILTTAAAAECDVQVQAAGTTVFRAAILATEGCYASSIESQPTGATGSAMTILLPTNAATAFVDYFIGGYEQ